jgi:hypothetical protein
MFNAKHCKVGHKVLAGLIDEHPHNKANGEDVAAGINKALGIKADDRAAWTPDAVKVAVAVGAFDKPGKREFYFWRGRYGGYRDVDLEAQAVQAEAEAKKEKANRKRKATKAEAQTPTIEPEAAVETQSESTATPKPETKAPEAEAASAS